MANPDWAILDRTYRIIQTAAANGEFVAAQGERVRSVIPQAVRVWKVLEGSERNNTADGLQNLIMPGILITPLPVDSTTGAGLNCADDEVHRIAIQIVDSTPHQHESPARTYTNWMNVIRLKFTTVPNPFLQDADPEEYDPFVVHPLKRLPADAQSLVRHEQQVAMFTFQVMVRHHR